MHEQYARRAADRAAAMAAAADIVGEKQSPPLHWRFFPSLVSISSVPDSTNRS
jgi:hypothetical protein